MALDDLLSALEADAAEEAAVARAEAEAEAARIVEAARAEARALEQREAQAVEEELEHEAGLRRAAARLEAAALVRQAREAAFQALLDAVRRRLEGLRGSDVYRDVLRALIEEALAAVPAAAATVRVDPRDELLARELLEELGASVELQPSLRTAGGLELATGDGRTVRNTLEERLRNAEPELRLLLEPLLDPGGAGTPALEREPVS